MTNPLLFQPFTLRGIEIRNRLWVPPMCQYSAESEGEQTGAPNEWHAQHLGALGRGGAGLVIAEATAVLPEGRISPNCVGIWNRTQQDAWAEIVPLVKGHGARVGIQLAHAGRKAATAAWFPDRDTSSTLTEAEGGWQPVGPTDAAFTELADPRALSTNEIREVIDAFIAAAGRAVDAGFDVVEIHAAHGYLIHEFLSPLVNTREDEFGGSPENRARMLREIVRGIRAAHPELPILVRVSGDEWVGEGFTVEECAVLVRWLKEDGADFIDASSGGNVLATIPIGPGYQVWLAERLRKEGLPTGAVGLISSPEQAEQILVSEQADVIFVGRPMLVNPHLPLVWAHKLRADQAASLVPKQYWRAHFKA